MGSQHSQWPGRSHLTRSQAGQASRQFRESLRLAKGVGDLRAQSVALFGIARTAASRGNLEDARAAVEQVLPIVDSLRTRVASPNLRASYFATLREPYDFYVELLMQMHRSNPDAHYDVVALEMLERARARALLETLSESRTVLPSGAESGLLEKERSLRELIEGKREVQVAVLSKSHTNKAALTIQNEIDELLTQYGEVEGEIRAKSPHYASLTQPKALGLKAIQQLLEDDTLLLEFWLGKDCSYGWAVTRNALTTVTLPKADEITKAARRMHEVITERSRRIRGESDRERRRRLERAERKYMAAATVLSQMVLGPLASQLGHKRLVIVTDGALHYVPFGALLVAPARELALGHERLPPQHVVPLIMNHEIVRLPSAAVLAVLRNETASRSPAPKAAIVFADPVFTRRDKRVTKPSQASRQGAGQERTAALGQGSSNAWARESLLRSGAGVRLASGRVTFRRLVSSAREGKAILKMMPKGSARRAFDFDADRETAMSSEMAQYRIVHFATDGLVNDRPELSGLVLSLVDRRGRPRNGFLTLQDIYNLTLRADLVVLSACQTALGKEIKGEGLVALARGFMHAGAPRVVASLWKVDDLATAELMQRFYTAMLQGGKRPAAALRAAQIDMWTQARWSSPFFWAGFELQGEWQ